MALPSGTVIFLFTDVEGSTKGWEQDAHAMRAALVFHDSTLESAIHSNGGVLFKKTGDGICAAFCEATPAALAALEAQQKFSSNHESGIRVRMGIYTGAASPSDGDYVGPTTNRTARLLETAHGGQIVLSQATYDLIQGSLPTEASVLDLGLHNLRDLERAERIYQLCHPQIPHTFPPLRSLSAYKHNLPIQLTNLIGREGDVQAVLELLDCHPLVTLYGSGGCGKTRLALQIGAEQVERFPDGVWFIELSNAADALQGEQALVSALGLREEAGRDSGQAIIEHLREKTALIILDNCEHLVEAAARQALELLHVCPNLKLLTTSREVLGVRGEITYRVPSLQIPDAASKTPDIAALSRMDSVRLFTDRAKDVDSAFEVTPKNAESVVNICARLDGIPLALELAAARVKTLTLEQIWERLRDHFHILVGPRTAPSRQTTLHATVDWSFKLLGGREQSLLSRLTVFAGSWTLEAAESVCAAPVRGRASDEAFEMEDVLDLLARLEEKSLISVDRGTEFSRYRMLQMVREYASQVLPDSESAEVAGRHVEYFLGMAEEAEANISGPEQGEWLKRLDRDHDNLRAAFEICKRNPDLTESGLRLAGSLARYWHIRGYFSEGRRQITSILLLVDQDCPSRGLGASQNGAGILAWAQNDKKAAYEHYTASLDCWRQLNDELLEARTLGNMGLLAIDDCDFAKATALLNRSLEIRQSIGDVAGQAASLENLGLLAYWDNRLDEAFELFHRVLTILKANSDRGMMAATLNNLGNIAFARRDFTSAARSFLQAYEIYSELGDMPAKACSLFNLGDVAIRNAEYANALDFYEQALSAASAMGNEWWGIAATRTRQAEIAMHYGDYLRADSLFVSALKQAVKHNLNDFIQDSLLGLTRARKALQELESATIYFGAANRAIKEAPQPGGPFSPIDTDQLEVQLRNSLGNERFEQFFEWGYRSDLDRIARLSTTGVQLKEN